MFDLIIRGGSVIDGSGNQAYISDIGINDGKIVKIGLGLTESNEIIDAKGLVVAPGFIDSHSHADSKILISPQQSEKLEQGITTSIAGQCGGSAAPKHDTGLTMGSFLKQLNNTPIGANFACFVGHGTIRQAVMGERGNAPTVQELTQMQNILRDSFEQGASGLSFGLFYAPGCHASTDEAIAMAKVAAEFNKPIAAHIRSEGDDLIEAVTEFITIVRQSGVRGILSHHKAVQRRNWGKVQITLQMLKAAVVEGLDIYCDVYPYCASSTKFSQLFIPHEWRAGGTDCLLKRITDPTLYNQIKNEFYAKHGSDTSWILINSCPSHCDLEGLTLDKIAEKIELDPFDAAMKLIVDSNDCCNACFFSVSEDDLKQVMAWSRTMICTDSGLVGNLNRFHPRMIGSFPRAIGRYVRQQKVVPLEEMVRKMTFLPATVYGIKNKGLIREGYDADICIFDQNKIIDHADFINCSLRADGINYVLLAGHVIVQDSVHNGSCFGKVL